MDNAGKKGQYLSLVDQREWGVVCALARPSERPAWSAHLLSGLRCFFGRIIMDRSPSPSTPSPTRRGKRQAALATVRSTATPSTFFAGWTARAALGSCSQMKGHGHVFRSPAGSAAGPPSPWAAAGRNGHLPAPFLAPPVSDPLPAYARWKASGLTLSLTNTSTSSKLRVLPRWPAATSRSSKMSMFMMNAVFASSTRASALSWPSFKLSKDAR
mmetsp:Transcript_37687/g.104939  ORF Transcript_37687/g.104939 Transcript_37687/m.104939 type:complete len:214 (-) Transcript_37687:858-1499(-)